MFSEKLMLRYGLLVGICGVCVMLVSCDSSRRGDDVHDPVGTFDLEALRPKVASLCGACHAYPEPSDFPKRYWRKLVDNAYGYYRDSPREDLKKMDVPPIEDVVQYYSSQAREELGLPPPNPRLDSGGFRFRQETIPLPAEQPFAAVSHIRWWPSDDPRQRSLLVCDMASGEVQQLSFEGRNRRARLLVKLDYPDHVEPCDLDGDGYFDFVVAELGSFGPMDHNLGRVVWLRWDPTKGKYEAITLQQELGRVADVQPADLDGDGDLDLAVAEFGWRKTGRVLLLEQIASASEKVRFRMHVLDERHGSIHVPVVDMNGDGLSDLVALIAQQHETIVAYLNEGGCEFQMQQVFGAPRPSYGSSGIQLTDLDGDGDFDVLYTNGDSFDTFCLQPYHSVQWLENRGSFPFKHHPIVNLPGAYRALACDLDTDGDQDVVVCSMTGEETPHNALIWFEQKNDGAFLRHDLEYSTAQHATMEIGDFDGNGYLDFAVGHYHSAPSGGHTDWLTFWWNEGPE